MSAVAETSGETQARRLHDIVESFIVCCVDYGSLMGVVDYLVEIHITVARKGLVNETTLSIIQTRLKYSFRGRRHHRRRYLRDIDIMGLFSRPCCISILSAHRCVLVLRAKSCTILLTTHHIPFVKAPHERELPTQEKLECFPPNQSAILKKPLEKTKDAQ